MFAHAGHRAVGQNLSISFLVTLNSLPRVSFPRVLLDWMPSSSAASDADAGAEDGSSNLTRFSRTPWCVSSLGLTGPHLSWPFPPSFSSLCIGCAWLSLYIDLRFRHTCWSQVPRHSFEILPTCLIPTFCFGQLTPKPSTNNSVCSDTNHGTSACVLSKMLPVSLDSS